MATNVELKQTGSKLVITIDLTANQGPSKSGKTTLIATTSGAIKLPSGEYVNLNVYKK